MPVSITANASARYAQTSLTRQNDAVTKSTLRMSAGQRVLSAADDASSMAIGTSLKIENSGLKSAILNASNGTSMLQIADGSMGQIAELMTRMQTLAVQASSGQYDDATRVLIDGEFQGLKAEVDRLAQSTKFNGVPILTGSKAYDITGSAQLAGDGILSVRVDPAVMTAPEASYRYSYDAATENLTLTQIDGATATSQTINLTPLLNGSVGAGVNLQNNQKLEVGFSQFGVTLTLGSDFDRLTTLNNPMTLTPGASMTLATPTFAVGNVNAGLPKLANLTALAGAYTAATGVLSLGLTASGAAGTVTLDAVPGISYKVYGGAQGASGAASADLASLTGGTVEIYGDVTPSGSVLLGTLTLGAVAATAAGTGNVQMDIGGGLVTATATTDVAPTHLIYKIGTGVLSGEDTIGVDVPAMTLKALQLENLTVATQFGADDAIDKLKVSLDILNQGRASVGAQQLRMETVGRNLGVISDNNEAARSALLDVDVSKEISDLTTNSAMMQASIAMLSRANSMPDILLELLRN